MNFVGGQISDALQVWDNAKSGATASLPHSSTAPAPKEKSGSSKVDMTFITPSLLGECSSAVVQ
jgi:hypothetical protein